MVLATLPRKTRAARFGDVARRDDSGPSRPPTFAPPMRASRAHIRRTPLLESGLAGRRRAAVSLKLECLQATGSFKARGAFHNLLTRPAPARRLRHRLGRQSRRSGRLCRPEARDHGARVRAGNRDAGEDRQDPGLRRRGRRRRRRSMSTRRQLCDAYVAESGALLDPSLRRGRDDRRPGHGRARMGGGPRTRSGCRSSTRCSSRSAAAG